MQIQLKQQEIKAAITQYIASQGINLTNKDVAIGFTAGRKESGMSAEVMIEDTFAHISEDDESTEATLPAIKLVSNNSEPAADTEEEIAIPEVGVVKTSSLFN